MQVPAAMFIESAADILKKDWGKREWVRADQQKELGGFGDVRAQSLGEGVTGLSPDFRAGYELGLQTARVILAGSGVLAIAKVNPDDLL